MSWRYDEYDGAIILDGHEKGIADDPTTGISDMRNVNIVSVPGEASVNFTTSQISAGVIASNVGFPGDITVTGLSSNAISFSGVTGLEKGMAIEFSAVGGLTGVSINTTYWVNVATGTPTTSITLYSDYLQTSAVVIGGAATGTPKFHVYAIGVNNSNQSSTIVDFTYTSSLFGGVYFLIDGLGQTWTNQKTTPSGFWEYTGNTGTAETVGTGIGFLQDSLGNGFIFAFKGQSIDYFSLQTNTWTYGWKPSTGGTHQTGYLKTVGSHRAMFGPDSVLYYCDGNYIGSFFQTDVLTPTAFNPTSTTTYTFAQKALLPGTDKANCLAFLGSNLLIGGSLNVIYSWNRSATNISNFILLAENNVVNMVTVNTNTFVFMGNRGRIYVTNGTNVNLYKKVPDHISGTVEPYFTWGGATSVKNQLYFSVKAVTNAGVAINQYGGVWAVDVDTNALRLTNELSYLTYAGYATALIPNFATNPAGTGLYIGWDNGSFGYGVDTTTSSLYTGSQATIDYDLIPIGSFNKPNNSTGIEYKLTRPLVAGESVVLKTRLIFNTRDTGYTTTLTDSTIGHLSGTAKVNFSNAQWLQIQAVLNSTASSPSYVRLKQIRILGVQV